MTLPRPARSVRLARPARSTSAVGAATLSLTLLLGLAACSDGDDPGTEDPTDEPTSGSTSQGTESAAPDDDRSADEVLEAATDATLDTSRFAFDNATELTVGETNLALAAEGKVDYDAAIADVSIGLDQDGQSQQLEILADGTTLWIAGEGGQLPPFPDGATYVSGDASRLTDSETFDQPDLLGLVYVLRAGDDAEEGEAGETDGVDNRTFSFTVPYADAVEAAGEDAEAFQSSLNLTGAGEDADLVVEVQVGSDDVVRSLTVEIDAGDLPLSGQSELSLSEVGAEVTPPEAPADDEVASGPEADALLDQLIS